MNLNKTSCLTLAAALLVCNLAGAAETINRKRGDSKLTGEITDVSKTEVTIKTSGKGETVKVPANEVGFIEWTGDVPELRVARSEENRMRYQTALDGYQKSLAGSKATNKAAKSDLEFSILRCQARIALAEPAKIDDVIPKLDEFRTKNSDHFRFYEAVNLLGQLYVAKKDYIKAQVAFDQLGRAPWKDTQMLARVSVGKLLLDQNKADEAAAEYDAVIALKPEGAAEESARQQAVLGKTRILIGQKKYEDGLKLLDEIVKTAADDDAKVKAEAYLRQGDCLREQGNDKDALIAYLHVDVLFRSEGAARAEALYRLVQLWEKVGQKGRAEEAREFLRTEYESTEWAKQLKGQAAPTTEN